jgi:hypothetical protein
MKQLTAIVLLLASFTANAESLKIDVSNEIELNNGVYLAKEFDGERYALISHDHGRFEGSDIGNANCTTRYKAPNLPLKWADVMKTLKNGDVVFSGCSEK